MKKIVALLPMRHDSQRVPGKNYRPMAGRPLYHYIVETLLACREIAEVVVDTDSPNILEGLTESFVTRWQSRLWDALGRAINHNPAVLLRTQDLPPVYEENSCIYVFTRKNLISKRNRIGERPFLFQIEAAEAWDIDEEIDFQITEFLLTHRKTTN
ncbi:MAG: hypothetical protein P8Y14_23365 [Anaerolineales bacterium]